MLLVIPETFIPTGLAAIGTSLAILVAKCGLSVYSAPFVDDNQDYIEILENVVICVTLLFAMIVEAAGDPASMIGLATNVVNILNIALLEYILISGSDVWALFVKNGTGELQVNQKKTDEFDSENGQKHMVTTLELVPLAEADLQWRLHHQMKIKVWHSFWDGMLKQCWEEDGATVSKSTQENTAEVENNNEVAARLAEAGEEVKHAAADMAAERLMGEELYEFSQDFLGESDSQAKPLMGSVMARWEQLQEAVQDTGIEAVRL